ncbi:signal recognition particle-docking protein FtsY, partial [Salmonella enterica subsp. enterica serovar Agona]|nr:signal recognition particle-docking protein FtsY [Salmonella enterica subsp. enterica serovar Agona]EED6800514.1 signal recognition particle-docking protein FtsY [Salmonella enterica subsp. enterica serovar Agona]
MAKQKKRGFFSWLGFGDKEQKQEQTEEQQIVEEQRPVEPPVETAADVDAQTPAHSKAETEAFAEEVVDVTEKVQESEKPQPVEPEPAAAIETAAPQIAVEREELPLPEEVKDEAISAEEWQAEAETVEVIAAVEEEGENAAKFTDEELEAQALAAQA